MSRIGRLPIDIPAEVTIEVAGQDVAVKGPKGELSLTVARPIEVKVEEGQVLVTRPDDEREFSLGFSHPVLVEPPDGITFTVEGNNKLTVSGIDKQAVGEAAANIRKIRKPEPYKGKGVRYAGEVVRRKAGKSGK